MSGLTPDEVRNLFLVSVNFHCFRYSVSHKKVDEILFGPLMYDTMCR